MLIRFFLSNTFSFGEEKEFNMLPNPNGKRLKEHKYIIDGFPVLKLASIYGANAAGKSNLIRGLDMLKHIVLDEKIYLRQKETQFKFREKDEEPQILAVEFFQKGKAYYYAVKIIGDIIETEELYESGLGKREDTLLYERKTIDKERISVHFYSNFNTKPENVVLKNVIEKNLAKPNKSILKLLTTLNNNDLENITEPFNWFNETLQIITPESKPTALAHRIDIDSEFKKYTQDTICSFHVGISELYSEKKDIKEFFGEDDNEIIKGLIQDVESSPKKMIGLRAKNGLELIIGKEDDKYFVKQLKLKHKGKLGKEISFNLNEESDGTVRLLDFIPAFNDIFSKNKVYFIDEIERSLHPVLIKELVSKFSSDNKTKGQLMFTTHESNLLDQNIFRQDEIWFTEKDKNGSTDLYSLSDFKEHSTIDIRKGYLTGRYGSIPFLGNLQDLNWHSYDTKE
ncbi:ATP-binding protein [Bacteroidales bacterium OttesenSCG-928-I14]|nr:ATP-binding protein [Bacteroidales bacterium OttesenSCG-928-I14]